LKILVIGGGGREHAIAWRLALEGHQIFCSPGNPGTAQIARNLEIEADLTVVGPEAPLVDGIVDRYRARGLAIVGPTQQAAQLEASKIHSKEFMRRIGIPTARFVRVETAAEGLEALDQFEYPIVVKADGLAAGKGVIIAQNRQEAAAAVGSLGPRLVIEEFLEGEEVSFIVLSDGRNVVPLEATQDHKAVGEGDTGPNTGGMGAYCDGRILSTNDVGRILDTVIEPAVRATGFTGFLYAGIMMTASGPKVLEFNVRLGDPETQALMHRIDDDFAGTLARAAEGTLGTTTLKWKKEPSVCVVMAAAGYPGSVRTGDPITIGETSAQVFHAGTKIGERGLETSGGRVLGVTASGPDLASAVRNAYLGVEKVQFEGMHYRRDIAKKGLKRWYN
jgi:phosphoribosylamine--glycine ligase